MDPNDISKHITPRKSVSMARPPRPQRKVKDLSHLERMSTEELLEDVRYKELYRAEQLRLMPYAEYLQTPEWQEMRRFALEAAGHRCQVCNSAKSLQVHHRTYERRGHEDLQDLTVLCKSCHELYHKKSSSKEEAREHAHNFKLTVKEHATIRMCKGCGQSSILISGTDGYQWQMVKER